MQTKAHVYQFGDSRTSGGESLLLRTKIVPNKDEPYTLLTEQELTLHSYCNCATFHLLGTQLMPDDLRAAADELEDFLKKNGIDNE